MNIFLVLIVSLFRVYISLIAGFYVSDAKHGNKPCRSFIDLWYDYNYDESVASCTEDHDTLHVRLVYNTYVYKEIRYHAAYTVWDLFSSIGVIIGVFLGGSLLQLPDLLEQLHDNMKKEKKHFYYEATPVKKRLKVLVTEIQMMQREIAVLKLPMVKRMQTREYETPV